jgi:predicted signal transduction protein with EAL and GGDEF domain
MKCSCETLAEIHKVNFVSTITHNLWKLNVNIVVGALGMIAIFLGDNNKFRCLVTSWFTILTQRNKFQRTEVQFRQLS